MCRDKHIPVSDGFALSITLGDPVKIMEWQFHGLPKDKYVSYSALQQIVGKDGINMKNRNVYKLMSSSVFP